MGERSWLSTQACQLAESLYRLGRYPEAEDWVGRGLDFGDSQDASTQIMALGIQARLAARQGSYDAALRFATAALAVAETIQAPMFEGHASVHFAEVLMLADDRTGAAAQLRRAIKLFAAKGATVYVERTTQRLNDLD